MSTEPTITVGILSAREVRFRLDTPYYIDGMSAEGEQTATAQPDGILWKGKVYKKISLSPTKKTALPSGSGEGVFRLYNVTIGKQFHWERQQIQVFTGTLHLVLQNNQIVVINELPLEDYLISVISSEMKNTCSLEFLKASAVISRSWLLAQLKQKKDKAPSCLQTNEELIRWWDREDHDLFDVCADDHCQRYQGITRASSPAVAEAIKATRGQVLMSENELCDARFSKCCGGQTEEFQYCWENIKKPYLVSVSDPFCHTSDRRILSQVLNDYDQETPDFYERQVEYTQEELTELVNRKTKLDLGDIVDLIPLDRGKSGRIWRLQLVGTNRSFTIGKELEIRRALSETHLYSSAFDVEKRDGRFILHGRGWGHGVGLCQIGAAVMGEKGYDYDDILLYYYRGAEIKQIY